MIESGAMIYDSTSSPKLERYDGLGQTSQVVLFHEIHHVGICRNYVSHSEAVRKAAKVMATYTRQPKMWTRSHDASYFYDPNSSLDDDTELDKVVRETTTSGLVVNPDDTTASAPVSGSGDRGGVIYVMFLMKVYAMRPCMQNWQVRYNRIGEGTSLRHVNSHRLRDGVSSDRSVICS